jgi:hypothetical protein
VNDDLNNTGMDHGDSFEERLRATPLTGAPRDLRSQVLATARPRSAKTLSITAFLRQFLWPHPWAWGGIAALWMIILGFRLATPSFEAEQTQSGMIATQDDETRRLAATQQAALLAWLRSNEQDLPRDTDRPKAKPVPGPRSSLNVTNRTA